MLACISSARSRDVGKTFKTLPAVTNSLVNLGKMDFAFYFNVHPEGKKQIILQSLESKQI